MEEKSNSKNMQMVRVLDIEKRRVPSKHYVFVLEITWSDGTQNVVYRRYSHFFSLQTSLIDAFPVEGGVKDPSERILPFLPGKVIFRSHVREVALKRKSALDEYCKNLVKLPEKILKSEQVTSFFQPTKDDIANLTHSLTRDGSLKTPGKKKGEVISDPVVLDQYIALSDFTKCGKGQISVVAGDVVEVIEKSDNGWFFVSSENEQGWVPCSYLEPVDGKPDDVAVEKCLTEEKFVCVKSYKKSLDDELDLELGAIVDVTQKGTDGWWEVRFKGKLGWVPRAHLKSAVHLDLSKQTLSAGIVKDRESLRIAGNTKAAAPPRRKTVKRTVLKRGAAPGNGKNPLSRTASQSEYVALSDYQVNIGNKKVNMSGGKSYTVMEMAPNGWSLIKIDEEEGWVPSDLLNRQRIESVAFTNESDDIYQNVKSLSPIEDVENMKNDANNNTAADDATEEHYVTIGDYVSNDESGISFKENAAVTVLEKSDTGWWYIQIGSDEGWAPSTYLKRVAKKRLIRNGCETQSQTIDISVAPTKPNRKSQIPQSYENVGLDDDGKGKNLQNQKPPIPKPRTASRTSSDESNASSPIDELKAVFSKSRLSPNLVQSKSIDQTTISRSPKPAPRKISEPAKRPARPEKGPSPINIQGKFTPPLPNRPSTPKIPPPRPSPIKIEMYETICDYTDDDEGMLSFRAGEKVQVLEKDDGGWWLGMIGIKKGWVPSNFLQKQLIPGKEEFV